jgi:hypothetical protein
MSLLLEDGFNILLEDGSSILLEDDNIYNISNLKYNFLDSYRKYTCMIEPEEFPQGGPYAQQDIPIEKLKILKTPKGIINLSDIITINNISEKSKISFNAINYNNIDDSCDGFELQGAPVPGSISPDLPSEFTNDRCIRYQNRRHVKFYRGTGNNDVIFEAVFKPDNHDFIIFEMDYGSEYNQFTFPYYGFTCEYIDSSNKLTFHILGTEEDISIDTNDNSISSEFSHILICVRGMDGNLYHSGLCSIYINGSLSIESIFNNSLTGLNQNTYGYCSLALDSQSGYISYFKHWNCYNWTNSSGMEVPIGIEINELALDRYNKYINGNEDYYGDIPISIYTWGDTFGCIPIVCYQDLNNQWNLLFDGTTGINYKEGIIIGGIKSIRLFSKYEKTSNRSYFDDIDTIGKNINYLEIPKKYQRVIRRVIAQSKPLGTWAVLLIKWI